MVFRGSFKCASTDGTKRASIALSTVKIVYPFTLWPHVVGLAKEQLMRKHQPRQRPNQKIRARLSKALVRAVRLAKQRAGKKAHGKAAMKLKKAVEK